MPPSTLSVLLEPSRTSDGKVALLDVAERALRLRPLVDELRSAYLDKLDEIESAVTPIMLLDYSEIHYLWSSYATRSGRHGKIDQESMLIDVVIRKKGLRLTLPPGTILEIHRRYVDQGHRDSPRSKARDDDASALPKLVDVLTSLPAAGVFVEKLKELAARRGEAFPGFAAFADHLTSGRIAFYDKEPAHLLQATSYVFDAAYQKLRARAKSSSFADLCDALNVWYCAAMNHRRAAKKHVAYLVSRSRVLLEACRFIPGFSDPLSKSQSIVRAGPVRRPAYVYARQMLLPDDSGPDNLLDVGSLCNDLDHIRACYVVMSTSINAPDARTAITERRMLQVTGQIAALIKRHESRAGVLFQLWEAARRDSLREYLPFAFQGQQGDDSDADAARGAELLIIEAQRTREFFSDALSSGRTGRLAGLRVRQHSVSAIPERLVRTCVVAQDHPSPVLLIDYYDDYFSAWWNSTLDIHAFLDWVEDFYFRVSNQAVFQNPLIARRDRPTNWTYVLVVKEPDVGAPGGAKLTRQHPFEDLPESLQFPLDADTRLTIAHQASIAEAIRVYTPCGDLWLNFAVQSSGFRRTGLISQYSIPDVLAAYVGTTCHEEVDISELFKCLSSSMNPLLAEKA